MVLVAAGRDEDETLRTGTVHGDRWIQDYFSRGWRSWWQILENELLRAG